MGGGHGHGDAQGHGGHGGGPGGGHAEIPPAPISRWISPARADYEQSWPGRLLVWPVVWLGVALLLLAAARTWRHDWAHEAPAGGGHGPAAPGERGAHGD
jgi:hypothetical protein